jgi:tRNA 2-thiouridine synthesizing protein A
MGLDERLAPMAQVHCELDTSGLMCPLPLLRLKKALVAMECGQVVRVKATDPASVLDFGVFLDQAGHTLLERWEESGTQFYLIRKA